jgi:hypothetical protein
LGNPIPLGDPPTAERLRELADWGVSLWRENRERYAPRAKELPAELKLAMVPFFPARLLEQIRYVQLHGEYVELPQEKLREFSDFPRSEHQHGFMFIDVLVMNQPLTERKLFHSLVHAAQIDAVGIRSYMETYMLALGKTRAYIGVPFEIQAFNLEARFATAPQDGFSVADEVELWLMKRLY